MKREKKWDWIRYITLLMVMIGYVSCSSDDSGDDSPQATVPVAQNATSITSNSFIARWNNAFGAGEYQLDVATDTGFTSFVDGFENLSLNQLSQSVTGLDQNTNYYYRVRAVIGGMVSGNSNVINIKTNTSIPDGTTLKGAAENNFFVGVAVSANRIGLSAYDEVYTREFSSITAENDMKMNSIFTGIDGSGNIIYDWSKIDALIAYAEANNMNVHGHTLIWHRSVPQALVDFTGTDQEFEDIIEQYITDVFTRYQGKINSWDVVNEAIDDNQSIQWRDTIFLQRMGVDYVEKCFAFARAADPDVKLFYNDYNMTFDATKRGKVLALVDDLLVANVIDGVGYQMHIDYNFPTKQDIQDATNELVSKDVLVHFAELDVKLNAANDLTGLTTERSLAQKQRVREVVEIFNAIPQQNKYAITLWGLKDNDTWLIPENNGRPEWPLLFDASFEKKDAYTGFLEPLL